MRIIKRNAMYDWHAQEVAEELEEQGARVFQIDYPRGGVNYTPWVVWAKLADGVSEPIEHICGLRRKGRNCSCREGSKMMEEVKI